MSSRKIYPHKMRVLLTEEDKNTVVEVATKLSISEAEFIRQLIRKYVEEHKEKE